MGIKYFLFFILSLPVLHASENSSLVANWIDVKGQVFPGGKIQKVEWVWSKIKPTDPVESPALRVSIKTLLPKDWRLHEGQLEAESAQIVGSFSHEKIQDLTLDLREPNAILRFSFFDPKRGPRELALSIQLQLKKTYILLHPECAKEFIRLRVHSLNAKHFFAGLNCIEDKGQLQLVFIRSKDAQWYFPENSSPVYDSWKNFNAFQYTFSKPKQSLVYAKNLFKVGTQLNNEISEFSVYYSPQKKPDRFYSTIGLATQYALYREKLNQVEVHQAGLIGKFNLGYRLVPQVLDVALNGFATIFPHELSATPSTAEAARFYGLNTRIGYRLPTGLGASEFFFFTGYYFWGMLVDGSDGNLNYGIRSLSGPQVYLSMVRSLDNRNGYWLYLKWALISDRFYPSSIDNRELAMGGGYELSKTNPLPWAFTIDVSHSQYSLKDYSNAMNLLTATIGIQKAL